MNILGGAGTWAQRAFGTLTPLLTSTAPVWQFPIVQHLWHFSLALGTGLMLLLVLFHAGRHMTLVGEGVLTRDVLLPLAVSSLLMFGSLKVCITLIHLNNSLIAALGRQAIANALPHIPVGTQILDDLLFSLPYAVLILVLAVVYLVRSVEIMFLTALSPLGLLALAWPVSRPLGSRFLQELTVTVFVQAIQAFLLLLSRGLSGLEGAGSPQNGLLGLVVLYVLIRAPGYLRRWTSLGFAGASNAALLLRWLEL